MANFALSDRLTVRSEPLPDETRWEADYLLSGLFEEFSDEPTNALVDSLTELGSFVDDFEGTISAQTARLLAGVDAQRVALLDTVTGKREAVRNALGAERLGIQSFVDEEVDAMLTRFDDTGRGLIDHFFDRMVRILLGAAVFLTLLALLLIVGLRRGSSASTRGSSSSQSEDED